MQQGWELKWVAIATEQERVRASAAEQGLVKVAVVVIILVITGVPQA